MISSIDIRNKIYFFIACSLAMIVFVPARLAYGITLLLEFNMFLAAGIASCYLIKKVGFQSMKVALFSLEMICLTILFKQVLIFICPVMALTLGFVLYLPALSASVFEIFFKEELVDLKQDLKKTMFKSLEFTVFALVVYILREAIGFGTISFIGINDLVVLHIFEPTSQINARSFLVTIPGALVILSLVATAFIIVSEKINKLKDSENQTAGGNK